MSYVILSILGQISKNEGFFFLCLTLLYGKLKRDSQALYVNQNLRIILRHT